MPRSLPFLCALALAACAAAPDAAQTPANASSAAAKREPAGWRPERANGFQADLPDAKLYVPQGFAPPEDGVVPLFVHFQGGPKSACENFERMERKGVLIASTLSGRSGAFSKPYTDPAAFAALLAAGEKALSERCGRELHFGRIAITYWSAGYGAVRELLKHEPYYERIDALISADSMYAGVVADAVRAPRWQDVDGFVRFAQDAARGEKTLVLAYGLYPTEYASTSETAAFLLASVAARLAPANRTTDRGVPIAREAHVGGFHAYEFGESGKEIHVDILYFVPEMVRAHVRRP